MVIPVLNLVNNLLNLTAEAGQINTVQVDGEPTFEKVFEKVIREKYSVSEEFSLVNAYNAHVTGIKEDEAKVEEYKAMLQWRQEKKDELKAVFA